MAHLLGEKQPENKEEKSHNDLLIQKHITHHSEGQGLTYLSLARRTDIPTSLANSSDVKDPLSET